MSAPKAVSPWTPELDERLSALWSQGLTAQMIATALGVSKNSVVGRARRLDLPPRPNPINKNIENRTQWTEEDKWRLREMIDRGFAPTGIANVLGMSRDAVRYQIEKQNLKAAKEQPKHGGAAAMLGKSFGRRVLMEIMPSSRISGRPVARWRMLCACGDEQEIDANSITRPGAALMCTACARREQAAKQTDWTTLDEQLRELHRKKMTHADMAHALDVTISAIANRVERLGLSKRPALVAKPLPSASIVTDATRETTGPSNEPPPAARLHVFSPGFQAPLRRESMVPIPPPKRCDWVTNDSRPYLKCGEALRPGSAYCEHHYQRSRVKTRPLPGQDAAA